MQVWFSKFVLLYFYNPHWLKCCALAFIVLLCVVLDLDFQFKNTLLSKYYWMCSLGQMLLQKFREMPTFLRAVQPSSLLIFCCIHLLELFKCLRPWNMIGLSVWRCFQLYTISTLLIKLCAHTSFLMKCPLIGKCR